MSARSRAGLGWPGRIRTALAFGLSGRDPVIVSLAGFMLRGGLILLVLPAAVLPSVFGLAGLIGINAFAIDGRPTAAFFLLIAIVSTAIAVWLLLAALAGSLTDVWLMDAARDPDRRSMQRKQPMPQFEMLINLAGIRALCIVPLAVATAWAGSQIYNSAYNELTTPSNLAVPLLVRVFAGACGAIAVVVAVWLAQETVGSIAIRRYVLTGCGVWAALAGAVVQIARRPGTSAATVAVVYSASAVLMAVGLGLTAVTFDWMRAAARMQEPFSLTLGFGPISTTRDFRPVVFLLSALALSAAWIVSSALAGVASAWRNAAFTGETVAATSLRAAERSESELGLSERRAATSGH